MNKKSIKLFILFFVSISFYSCNGQLKSKHQQSETKNVTFGKLVSKIDNQIWNIFQDSKGNYWFGSNGKGVFKYDNKIIKQFTTKDGLISNQIRGIQEDINGDIYFETPQGISKYNGAKFTTLKVSVSPNNEWELNPNDLWFGYIDDLYRFDGELLYRLELSKQDLKNVFGLAPEGESSSENRNTNPYAIFGVNKDKAGHIWFGTESAGAFRYDGNSVLWIGEKELSILPDGRVPGVRSMIQDKNGHYWLSNFYHKYRIDPHLPKGYEKMKAVELPKEIANDKLLYFNSGIADQNGNLWMILYDGGVWKYDGVFLSRFSLENGGKDFFLICIYEDKDGIIWLGTDNDGVYNLDGDKFEKWIIESSQ